MGSGAVDCGGRSEIYSFATNSWRQCGQLLTDRRGMGTSIFVNPVGKRVIIGVAGKSISIRYSDVEFFDIDNELWISGPAFPSVIPDLAF